MITAYELEQMERFFLKELFHGIPGIRTVFKTPRCTGGNAAGMFLLEMSDDYCCQDDELYAGYKGYRRLDMKVGFAVGYNDGDLPWLDAINHPKAEIQISPELKKDKEQLVMTLLHELCHYYCWYTGLDYHDNDRQFIDTCKKLGVPTNFDFVWTGREWVRPEGFRETAKRYIELYEGRKCA